jgi:hypothetical protein
MTNVTLAGCWEMCWSFAGCNNVVMTARAHAEDLRMIDRGRRDGEPSGRERLMTRVAHIRTVNMIAALAAGGYVVMAADTAAGRKRRVIGDAVRWYPGGSGVAKIALARGGNMAWTFAGGGHIVMATGTNAVYFVVIHGDCRRPGSGAGGVAGVTRIRGINMRGSFATRDRAIVATDTSTYCLAVVYGAGGNRRPVGREFFMAGIAHVAAGNMPRVLTTGGHTVVTTDTVVDKQRVINRRRYPLLCAVAITALLGGRDVI